MMMTNQTDTLLEELIKEMYERNPLTWRVPGRNHKLNKENMPYDYFVAEANNGKLSDAWCELNKLRVYAKACIDIIDKRESEAIMDTISMKAVRDIIYRHKQRGIPSIDVRAFDFLTPPSQKEE